MRKFAVLGASALVLALGVAQASADLYSHQTPEQEVARDGHIAAPAASANSDFSGFRALVNDQDAAQAQAPLNWGYHRSN